MKRANIALILPYAAWMVLMTLLPSTPWAYAIRTCFTAAILLYFIRDYSFHHSSSFILHSSFLIGLLVCLIWVLPELFDWTWYRKFCIFGEGGTDAIAESNPYLIAVRLIGSAFVISIAEELFFRKFLIDFAGFWWMVALFAIEHDRWLVGAIAGVVYGWLYLKKGLFAAIIAHATTNLALGLFVLKTGQWQFW